MTDPLSNIELAPRAIRDLKSLDRQTRKRVQQAFQALGAGAENLDIKPVAGHAPGVACASASTVCSTANSPPTPTHAIWWHESSTVATYTALSTSSEPRPTTWFICRPEKWS